MLRKTAKSKSRVVLEGAPDNGYHAPSQELVCYTSAKGKLELINLDGDGKFMIHPLVDVWNSVEVSFNTKDAALKEAIISSADKVVEVYGKGYYREDGEALPYKMELESIRRVPDSKDLPKLSDFAGVAPDITGGKSVEEFLDDRREEWSR